MNELDVSVVIPVCDEAGNLAPLLAEIVNALDATSHRYEVIFVDDGSCDASAEELRALRVDDQRVSLLFHTKTFGQSAALATGFRHARGRVVVTMDADRQHDPSEVPRLIAGLVDGVACVCGVRTLRRDDLVRRLSSKLANGFRDLVTGDHQNDSACGFRAILSESLVELPVWNGMHRFLPTLLRARGLRVVDLPIRHRPRLAGVSKYGVHNRLWRGILDCFAVRWYRARAVPLERTAGG